MSVFDITVRNDKHNIGLNVLQFIGLCDTTEDEERFTT